MKARNIIIDCDPGMDDSIALIIANKSPMLSVKAITAVAGNYEVDITSKNALKSLELIGVNNVPTAMGMEKPLIRDLPKDPFSHGKDGQGDNFLPEPKTKLIEQHAVDLIIDTVKKYKNNISIIALGPLTNIAMSIMKAPEIKPMISEITAIAGAYGINKFADINATGDNPQSEWNVFVDPEAADIVFQSGIKVNAIGLDVATHFDVDLSDRDISELDKSSRPESAFLKNMIDFVKKRGFESYCVLIDSLAVAANIDPTLLSTIVAKVGVETKGQLTLGMTILDRRHHFSWTHLPKINVAIKADYEKFIQIVMDIITK